MLFNSYNFLVFFPIVTAIYFAIPSHRFRMGMLLFASYYFYMSWKPEYAVLIIISTLIDYFAGIQMGKIDNKKKRKKYLVLSLCSNLGLLFAFKYFNFFNDSLRELFNYFNIFYNVHAFKLLLPVGISFYTFQTLSYTIDVYRSKIKPEKHLGTFALYVSFFPQLVAGPIERAKHLLPQFGKKKEFNYQRIADGIKLMAWGFFKKMVIADRVAVYVNHVYENPGGFYGAPLILATYFFAFQIYCDFSGYSDIAIGSAKILGFDLMDNFRRPYFSKSISEFWRRWHISLSNWFRDYLYIPLGGNRVKPLRWYFNIFIVFLLSGLWHGANSTFVAWGSIHGGLIMFSQFTQNIRAGIVGFLRLKNYPRLYKTIQIFITFHLVLFTWVFFRAQSISEAFVIFKNMFIVDFSKLGINVALGRNELIIAFSAILLMESVHLLQRNMSVRQFVSKKPSLLKWSMYIGLAVIIVLFGKFNSHAFIYFQF